MADPDASTVTTAPRGLDEVAAPPVDGTHRDDACPLQSTHDKYNEAHYFLEQMMVE